MSADPARFDATAIHPGRADAVDPDDLPAPLFILGSPRSFTSLICAMLGQNPRAYGLPEMNLFLADTLQDLVGELAGGYRQIQLHGLLRTVAQLYGGEQSMNAIDLARRWLMPRLSATTGEVYRELAAKIQPLHLVDKSPSYGLKRENLDRLNATFPNARYLHLLRHPLTQGESIMRIAKGLMVILADSIDYDVDPPVIDPQIIWLEMQKTILDFLADFPEDRQMQLRGEDVLSDPGTFLPRICEWMELPCDADAMARMMHPEDSPYASLGPLGAHLGNDPNFLRSAALRASKARLGTLTGALPWRPDGKGFRDDVIEMATRLGYE